MNLKKLNTVNEVKDFVNRGKVVYYNVNGCGIKADSNLFNELVIYDNVRDVYHLWHCDNSFEGVKGSGLITYEGITSMCEKGVFTTPCDYVELHFHLETKVNIPYRMYYGTFEHYTYIVNKVYENGKDCGYRVIPTLRYIENITQSYINICEIFNKFIKTFDKLVYPITNGEDIKKQFLNDFNNIENGLNYGCVFRYSII